MSTSPTNDDDRYFALRERQVREMAAKAKDPAARAIHEQLAKMYAKRLRHQQSA